MGKEYGGLLRTTFLIDPDGNIKDVIEKSTLPSTVLICWQKWGWQNQSKLQPRDFSYSLKVAGNGAQISLSVDSAN